ncbi:glutamine synthetase family protein [Cognatiyoonia sp. IB215182]|uniref:glutamine synthetase family protein n=1 Tax=Cognatiyoonia sp. IB215182 TaxID=3097353 RepID=UPI002A13B27E|nr:glutamine synthetase family protein [Cognatiyoonia sp. IB215182]MDX8355697.1 glutamine synthetase family protein [Cognatiyoonia sp. IB215182]
MSAALTFDALKDLAASVQVDTVLVCFVDMQGRLMGKRFHVSNFLEAAHEETHCCDYLLATDLEMSTPDGYAASSWQRGYGDYVMKPDLSTLRPMPWLEGTVMVLCDILDHHTHAPVPHAPRQVLKEQIARLAAIGLTPMMATELEFFIFKKPLDQLRAEGYRELETLGAYNEDYHIFQTSKEEHVMRPLRNHLYAAGIPVENSKGEAEAGQEELNIRYADALACADHHTIAKHAAKEIAWQQGHSASFLPKWHHTRVGSASHVHMSLWRDGANAFHDPEGTHHMSALMRQFMAGLITYAPDCTYFFAPYINSYKRFAKGTFAPTKTAWSVDNRTAGFRLCGADTKAVRVECRIPGSDMNPYLAQAALLAAGIRGIEDKLDLAAAATGDMYDDDSVPGIPKTLRAATEQFTASKMLRAAMGDAVVDHYTRAATWEQEEFNRVVTDWEIARGFEKA